MCHKLAVPQRRTPTIGHGIYVQTSALGMPSGQPTNAAMSSADLVAELRLPNAQIADRRTLHVKWTRPAQEREQIAPPRQDNEMQPVGPPTIQHRGAITAAPPISAEPPQGQSTGNTVKVFAHAERTICAGQSMKLIDVPPPSRPCMSARAAPRSRILGLVALTTGLGPPGSRDGCECERPCSDPSPWAMRASERR
jgi:hypothetical protein